MEIEDAKFLEFIARPRGLLFAWRMARQAFPLTTRVKRQMKRICLPPKECARSSSLDDRPYHQAVTLQSHSYCGAIKLNFRSSL